MSAKDEPKLKVIAIDVGGCGPGMPGGTAFVAISAIRGVLPSLRIVTRSDRPLEGIPESVSIILIEGGEKLTVHRAEGERVTRVWLDWNKVSEV